MGDRNPYRSQINADGFEETLKQGDPDAWGTLFEYVRKQAAYRLRRRPLPRDLNYEEAVEELAGEACLLIVEKLADYERRGPLSAYIDVLTRTATTDVNHKRLMEAVGRFLAATNRLPAQYQRELHELVRQLPKAECDMLLAHMHGERLDLLDFQRQCRWYMARRDLLNKLDFQHLLHVLESGENPQAHTVLIWLDLSKESVSPPQSALGNGNDEQQPYVETVSDQNEGWLEPFLKRERNQELLECLKKLKQGSPKQFQAVNHRHISEMGYAEIAQVLGAKEATVRKWVDRGLENLRKCLNNYLTGGDRDEHNDL